MIGLTDFSRQWAEISKDVHAAVERVGSSAWYILGNEVTTFESALQPWFSASHTIGCASGLDALELSLRALNVRPGDRVLTTPLTAFATTLAILRVGAVPVFADVDEAGLLDLADAKQRVQETVRFVLPVHLYGHMVSPAALRAFAKDHHALVIEDAAQAIGAKREGELVGSVGQLTATSFYPTKNLGALGDAGAVTTNNAELAACVRRLRDYGQSAKYVHDELGLNSRLDELQAAILRTALLPRLQHATKRRVAIAQRYQRELNGHFAIVAPAVDCDSVWHLFPLLVQGDREVFRQHLSSMGVATGLHYPLLAYQQKAFTDVARTPHEPLARAERFARDQVSIPLHPWLTDDEVGQVVDACNTWRG